MLQTLTSGNTPIMQQEINSFIKKKTFELVPLPSNWKAIVVKWVYKVKLNPDNTINKYKAQLYAKDFTQKQGIDFHDTYAPVAKIASIHLLFAVAAA